LSNDIEDVELLGHLGKVIVKLRLEKLLPALRWHHGMSVDRYEDDLVHGSPLVDASLCARAALERREWYVGPAAPSTTGS
jgi:hypothetical protein